MVDSWHYCDIYYIQNPIEGEDGVPTSIYMVFEYCDGDLSDLLKQNIRLSPDHIKCFTKQVTTPQTPVHK